MSDKATEGKRAARSAGGSHAGGKGTKKLLGVAVAAGKKVREGYSASTARSLYLATVLGAWHAVIGVGKIVSGALGASAFACANGLYTVCMGASRLVTATGAVHAGSGSSRRYARIAGAMLTAASALFTAYAAWTLLHPSAVRYPKAAALLIVGFTLVEIGLNVKDLIQTWGAKTAIEKALRIIGLASSLIALSLTQEAVLAVMGVEHDPVVSACMRCAAGLAAVALGVYVVARTRPGAPAANGWK